MIYFPLRINILFFFKIVIFYLCYFSINIAKAEENKIVKYQSIKFDKANLRVGPGKRYPIDWVLIRKNLPVAIIDKLDNFRKVQLYDGTTGWLHQSQLSNNKTGIITTETYLKDKQGRKKAKVLKGVIVKIKKCSTIENKYWCSVEVKNVSGIILQDHMWGSK